jgi:hypothetical protein
VAHTLACHASRLLVLHPSLFRRRLRVVFCWPRRVEERLLVADIFFQKFARKEDIFFQKKFIYLI